VRRPFIYHSFYFTERQWTQLLGGGDLPWFASVEPFLQGEAQPAVRVLPPAISIGFTPSGSDAVRRKLASVTPPSIYRARAVAMQVVFVYRRLNVRPMTRLNSLWPSNNGCTQKIENGCGSKYSAAQHEGAAYLFSPNAALRGKARFSAEPGSRDFYGATIAATAF